MSGALAWIADAVLRGIVGSLNKLGVLLSESWMSITKRLGEVEPTQAAVLWIQIVVGLLTILWIMFQFAWLRRLNESRLERHLEGTISAERDELADQRRGGLARLDRVTKRRGYRRHLLRIWAEMRLAFSTFLRTISFGTTRGLANHNMLMMQAGMEGRARHIYSRIALEALKAANLYEDAIRNKKLEAQNALIFAGRIALIEGRNVAAIIYFKKAMSIEEDADACLLIGRQLAEAKDMEGALVEYKRGLALSPSPATHSDIRRAIAETYMSQGHRVWARKQLNEAEGIDDAHRNYAGLGRTHELIGDLHTYRLDRLNAAKGAYGQAAENFSKADLQREHRRVLRKITDLESSPKLNDSWWVNFLNSISQKLVRRVERLRARARTKAEQRLDYSRS
jgi:tetratricopeptide (TPR) repeat protein